MLALLLGPCGGVCAAIVAPETGDLPRIRERGTVRIVHVEPREAEASSRDVSRALLESFAAEHGLDPVWIDVEHPTELVAFLLAGRADVVLGEVPLELQHHPGIAASLPIKSVRYVAVTRSGADIGSPADLVNRQVAVSRASPVWTVMARMASPGLGIGLVSVPGFVDNTVTLDQVAAGVFDAAVAPMRTAAHAVTDDARLRIAFDIVTDRPLVWHTRAGAPELRRALDEYLRRSGLTHYERPAYAADLEGIEQRGVLRVIARGDGESLYLEAGEPAGFDYDLVARFARAHELRVEVLVARDEAEMRDWLERGYGDLIVSRTGPEAATDAQISPSRAYGFVAPVVVGRSGAVAGIERLADLASRRVVVREGSLHARQLERLRADRGIAVQPIAVHRDTPARDLIELVASGRAALAVVDSNHLAAARRHHPAVRAALSLPPDHPHRWLARADHYALLGAVNDFLRSSFRSKHYNLAYRRYFERQVRVRAGGGRVASPSLSPYDALVRRYAVRYDFDWRLVIAQMYAESRFDKTAVSDAGARGLMQLLPDTARDMGFQDVDEPEAAIHAGVRYLDWLRERFEPELPITERTWFALAAYNGGLERIQAARRLARQAGLDPNRWFDNVEMVVLATMRSAGAAGNSPWPARCRCGETVAYVREIRRLYETYVQLLEPRRVAAVHPGPPGGES